MYSFKREKIKIHKSSVKYKKWEKYLFEGKKNIWHSSIWFWRNKVVHTFRTHLSLEMKPDWGGWVGEQQKKNFRKRVATTFDYLKTAHKYKKILFFSLSNIWSKSRHKKITAFYEICLKLFFFLAKFSIFGYNV